MAGGTPRAALEPAEILLPSRSLVARSGAWSWPHGEEPQLPRRVDDSVLFVDDSISASVRCVWIGALRDVAVAILGMTMAAPRVVEVSNMKRDLVSAMEANFRPVDKLMLVVLPTEGEADLRRLALRTALGRFAVPVHLFRAADVLNKVGIGRRLLREALGIAQRAGGVLWHVGLRTPSTAPYLEAPTMLIGVCDAVREGAACAGLAASTDRECSRFFLRQELLGPVEQPREVVRKMALALQRFVVDALVDFAARSDGLLPEHLVLYRARPVGRRLRDPAALDLWALDKVLDGVRPYRPMLTVITVEERAALEGAARGTVTTARLSSTEEPGEAGWGFSLRSAASTETDYWVHADTAAFPHESLQQLTHLLCHLCYPLTEGDALPSPLRQARRLSALAADGVLVGGSALRSCAFLCD